MVEGVVEEMFLGRSDYLGPLCFELQLLGSLYGGAVVVMLEEEVLLLMLVVVVVVESAEYEDVGWDGWRGDEHLQLLDGRDERAHHGEYVGGGHGTSCDALLEVVNVQDVLYCLGDVADAVVVPAPADADHAVQDLSEDCEDACVRG